MHYWITFCPEQVQLTLRCYEGHIHCVPQPLEIPTCQLGSPLLTKWFDALRTHTHALPQAGCPLSRIFSRPDTSPHVLPDDVGAQSRLECRSVC